VHPPFYKQRTLILLFFQSAPTFFTPFVSINRAFCCFFFSFLLFIACGHSLQKKKMLTHNWFMLFFACLLIIAPNLSLNPNTVEATRVLTINRNTNHFKGDSISIYVHVFVFYSFLVSFGFLCFTSEYIESIRTYTCI